MKLPMPGLPDVSRAEEYCQKGQGRFDEKEQKEEKEHISVPFMKHTTELKEQTKEK